MGSVSSFKYSFSYMETGMPVALFSGLERVIGACFGADSLATQPPTACFLCVGDLLLRVSDSSMTAVTIDAQMENPVSEALEAIVESHQKTLGAVAYFTLNLIGVSEVTPGWLSSLRTLILTTSVTTWYKRFSAALRDSCDNGHSCALRHDQLPTPVAELTSKAEDPSSWLFNALRGEKDTAEPPPPSVLKAPHRQEAVIDRAAKRILQELKA